MPDEFDMRMINKATSPEWKEYVTLMKERAWEFAQDPMLMIETDLEKVCRFEEQSGRTIGVVYHSPYSIMVVDLVCSGQGEYFAYERLLPNVPRGAVVGIPVLNGKYVLLEQFRHSMRNVQYAFPRGYAEPGLSAEENVKKELSEELGAEGIDARFVGSVVADSGISGQTVSVFLCRIDSISPPIGYESIRKVRCLNETELREWIGKGKITDGFTLAALCLADSHRE